MQTIKKNNAYFSLCWFFCFLFVTLVLPSSQKVIAMDAGDKIIVLLHWGFDDRSIIIWDGVSSMIKERKIGFLWIGTGFGLNRYWIGGLFK
jgi:hypothetical protein